MEIFTCVLQPHMHFDFYLLNNRSCIVLDEKEIIFKLVPFFNWTNVEDENIQDFETTWSTSGFEDNSVGGHILRKNKK